MDSIWVILSLSSWYYCVNLSHNVIIIMALLFLFGARCHYHHDTIGAQWGNLMIPLYDIIVFLFLGFFLCRGPTITVSIIIVIITKDLPFPLLSALATRPSQDFLPSVPFLPACYMSKNPRCSRESVRVFRGWWRVDSPKL